MKALILNFRSFAGKKEIKNECFHFCFSYFG